MATGYRSWSTTAATNASADSNINWSEGQAPSTVNDSARYMMKVLADFFLLIDYGTISNGTVGGTAAAITLTCSPTVGTLAAGQRYLFAFGSTTTGATTLTVDSTSAGALQYRGQALIAGDYATNDWGLCVCDGTNFQMLNPPRLSAQTTDYTTDTTGGDVADLLYFADASQSNASNKVTVQKFYDVSMAALTAKALPIPADYIIVADSAASNVAKSATVQHLFDSVTGITEDATAATGDFVLTNDVSASNVAKKVKISTIQTLLAASQANQETASSAAVNVTPSVQQYHPSATKFWVNFVPRGTNGSATINASYNVTSVDRTAAGRYTITFTVNMSSANYCAGGNSETSSTANNLLITINSKTTSTCLINQISASAGGGQDLGDAINVWGWGDQ